MAMKMYKVSLKEYPKEKIIVANNASSAIMKSKKSHFYAYKNVNNSHFNSKLFQKYIIEKQGIGNYIIYDMEFLSQYGNETYTKTKAKQLAKKLNLEYIKKIN